MNGDLFGVGLAVVLLAFNAFFVGAEFALLAARRSQIEPKAQEGSTRRPHHAAGHGERLARDGRGTSSASPSVRWGSVPSARPPWPSSWSRWFHGAQMPDNLLHPVSIVVTMSSWSTCTSSSARWCPRTSPSPAPTGRPSSRPAHDGGSSPCCARWIAVMNMASANGVLRLLPHRAQGRGASSFTREEVAALVEESRGEGLIEADEYDRLAGALGWPEKSVASIVMCSRHPGHRGARLHRRRRRGGVRGHRLQPLPGRRRRTAPCWATSTSRTPSSPTTTSARAGDRGQVDPSLRLGPPRRPAPRRAGEPPGQGRPHGAGRGARRERRSGWSRSRTCSRSSSARSATLRTTTCPASRRH